MVVKQATYDRAQKTMMSLPSFCAVYQDETGPVDEATAKLVADTWAICMAGTAAPYVEAHRVTPSITPLVFFYNTYYYHLFELAPEIRPLFTKSMVSQGRMLANMIKSVVVNIAQDYNLFRLSLEAMARNHNKMGIKSEYYALSGLVLFLTIRVCLGEKLYNEEIRIAWTRLYARMMQIIIPVAVSNVMPGEGGKDDYFMKVIKVQNHEGERGERDGKGNSDAKGSVTRTPPTEPISVTGLDNMADQLAALGDSLVIDLKRKLLAHSPSLIQDVSYKGHEYKQVMIGSQIVDWLIVNQCADTRPNAIRMASQLWNVGLRHVHEHDSLLDDYSFYYWLPDLPAVEPLGAAEAGELKLSILNESKLLDTRTYKLNTSANSIVASSLVDWLVTTGRAADRIAAIQIGRQLRHNGLRACHGHIQFDDIYELFTFDVHHPPVVPSKTSGIRNFSGISANTSGKSGSNTPSPGTPMASTPVHIHGNSSTPQGSVITNSSRASTFAFVSAGPISPANSGPTLHLPSSSAAVCPFPHSGSSSAAGDVATAAALIEPSTTVGSLLITAGSTSQLSVTPATPAPNSPLMLPGVILQTQTPVHQIRSTDNTSGNISGNAVAPLLA